MKDTWIEQEAFSSNLFQVGDRVRVYDCQAVWDGYVYEPSCDHIRTEGSSELFNYRQCRLLKKREPRGFYLREDRIEKSNDIWKEPPVNERRSGWIKVQEVIE